MKAPTLLAVARHRGTEISNPFPSSEESANFRSLSGGRIGLGIDETWAATNMTRRYGRAGRGLRLLASVPHGHWKVTTSSRLRQWDHPTDVEGLTVLHSVAIQ